MGRFLDMLGSSREWVGDERDDVDVREISDIAASLWLHKPYVVPSTDSGRRAAELVRMWFKAPCHTQLEQSGEPGGHPIQLGDELLLVQYRACRESHYGFSWLLVKVAS